MTPPARTFSLVEHRLQAYLPASALTISGCLLGREYFVEIFLQMKLLFQHGHQYVDADGDPNLGLHSVGRGAKEALDMQVLLDPFEEQFDLPATLVQFGDGQCRQGEVVGQIDKEPTCLGVEEANTPQSVGVSPAGCRNPSAG
jgi:hypothetical protein